MLWCHFAGWENNKWTDKNSNTKGKRREGGLSGEDFIVRIRPEMLLDMPARLPTKLTIFSSFWFEQSHVGTCNLEPVYCDNKCGQKVSRKQMMQHKAIECSKRLIACRYCAKDFSFDTLQAHHAKCGRYPIACPNQCDSPKVVREELESHLKENCPALMVSCPFKEAGCRFKVCPFLLPADSKSLFYIASRTRKWKRATKSGPSRYITLTGEIDMVTEPYEN